jgi:predicted nucleotidyltransferase
VPEFGVIFGSQVTGKTHEWSDIDLMVISPMFDESRTYESIGRLWRAAARVDSRIEPIACGARQWREDDGTPIIEVVRQEGVIVFPEVDGKGVRQAG